METVHRSGRRSGRRLAIAALTLLVGVTPGRAGDEPIVTSDLLKIRRVGSIDVSGDGSTAVYAVRSIAETPAGGDGEAERPSYEYRSHLYALDLFDAAASPRQLTFGARRDGGQVVSPDGSRVAFVRAGAVEGEGAQVWVLSLEGGEARQVTHFEHGAGSPQWSPDGRQLLVASAMPMSEIAGEPSWPMERPNRDWDDAPSDGSVAPRPDGTRAEIRAWLTRNAEAHDPFVINRLHFQDEQKLEDERHFTHLFLIDPDDPSDRAAALTRGFYSHRSARFVGDGEHIVYVTRKPADVHLDPQERDEIWIVKRDGTGDRALLSDPAWSFDRPRPRRDGTLLAFSAQPADDPLYAPFQIGVGALDADGPFEPGWWVEPKTFAYDVFDLQWSGAHSRLAFTTEREGGVPLMSVSAAELEPSVLVEVIDDVAIGVESFGIGGGSIVYAVTSPANPCVLRVRDGRGDRAVADLNPWVAEKRLSVPKMRWLTRPDGERVQWWIMEPTNREPGVTYPVVLEMHGGPHVMWGPGESTMWHEFQLLCSWGYGVVFANPRGSSGYGYDFQKGNYQNWGDGPAGDVLAALDQATLEEWVDRDRLLLTGGSYAGYLTAWIVGHDHRFKAAVAQRGVYDLRTFFGEGNAWQLIPWAMGGYPWEARARTVLQRESPFTYVDRIRTPLLIMHASNDLRTGVSQSEMLYRALKTLNRPVEYVRYPDAGHDLSRSGDPRQRMDRLNRIIEFFERFVANSREAPRIP